MTEDEAPAATPVLSGPETPRADTLPREALDVWSTSEPPHVPVAPDTDLTPLAPDLDLDAPLTPARVLDADAWGSVPPDSMPRSRPSAEFPAPLPLDGFTQGIESLDGLIVLSLADGALHGAWVRPDAGFSAEEVAPSLREAYRASLQAARKLATFAGAAAERAQVGEPIVTIETLVQTTLLKRIRAYVVACLFDASMPLGMARLCAARIAASLEPELPLQDLNRLTLPPQSGGSKPPHSIRLTMPIKTPHASPAEVDHVRRLIAYAEANLPDPHTVRLRLSLRSHTPRLALEHPETMVSDAVLRIETAVVDMLGIDREQLGLALLGGKS